LLKVVDKRPKGQRYVKKNGEDAEHILNLSATKSPQLPAAFWRELDNFNQLST